ncbi:MAG: hypothetical protein ABIH34_00970 [Nanoarchaeota archaeon]
MNDKPRLYDHPNSSPSVDLVLDDGAVERTTLDHFFRFGAGLHLGLYGEVTGSDDNGLYKTLEMQARQNVLTETEQMVPIEVSGNQRVVLPLETVMATLGFRRGVKGYEPTDAGLKLLHDYISLQSFSNGC